MTVREALEAFKGRYIKLGSKVGYMFCGLCDDDTPDVVDKLSAAELKRLQGMISDYEYRLKNFDKLFCMDNRSVDYYEIKRIRLSESIINYHQRVKEWIPYLNRDVKEIYKSVIHRDMIIILFKGSEESKFWSLEEYNKSIM